MTRPVEIGTLGEVFATDLIAEPVVDGVWRVQVCTQRGNATVEAVSVVMTAPRLRQELHRVLEAVGAECPPRH